MSHRTVGSHQGFNYGKGRPFTRKATLMAARALPAVEPEPRQPRALDGRVRWWKCRCGRTHKIERHQGKTVLSRCASCGDSNG